ncbi:SLC13 family permease [Euzebya sp.]|uniref:SLC13 family permease n=1 Tax=Euzebya sp. TaxID=1971409 RepID=UPI0035124A84
MSTVVLGRVLLVVAVVGMVAPPWRLPRSAAPVAGALVAAALGLVSWPGAVDAARPLWPALAFLVAAVPLALLLDRTGVFDAVAARVRGQRGLLWRAWAVAAVATALLNLDAAVVLLTPLYVRIADRTGVDRMALAVIPVLQASLASSALPASNLTNLIVVGAAQVPASAFLRELGPATVAAVVVGGLAHRRWAGQPPPAPAPIPDAGDAQHRGQVVLGAVVAIACAIGFSTGELVGVAPWQVAAVGVLVLAVGTRHVPLRALPVDAALLVLAIGILVAAVLPVPRAVDADLLGQVAAVVGGVGGSVVANNLPAVLAALPAVSFDHGGTGFAMLLGVNAGPVLALWASLAALLWLQACRGLGLDVDARAYHRVGWQVGGPALLAATAVRLAQVALTGTPSA